MFQVNQYEIIIIVLVEEKIKNEPDVKDKLRVVKKEVTGDSSDDDEIPLAQRQMKRPLKKQKPITTTDSDSDVDVKKEELDSEDEIPLVRWIEYIIYISSNVILIRQ